MLVIPQVHTISLLYLSLGHLLDLLTGHYYIKISRNRTSGQGLCDLDIMSGYQLILRSQCQKYL